jgi:hypothetical protein
MIHFLFEYDTDTDTDPSTCTGWELNEFEESMTPFIMTLFFKG